MATGEKQISISFTLDKDRVSVLRSAFPENEDIGHVANALAELITNELIQLLAGEKRYLSLSHQYIEWIQQIYEELLPEQEYTYEWLYNRFNFPPGTAAYMARVLRARQSSSQHTRAIKGLKAKLGKEVQNYRAIPPKNLQPSDKERNITLTVREYELLVTAVDRFFAKETVIELPKVTFRSKAYVNVSYRIEYIELVLTEVDTI